MLNEDVHDSIDRLVSKVGKKDNQKVLKEILSTVCRLSEMDINSGDWKLLSRSIKEFRKVFRHLHPSEISERLQFLDLQERLRKIHYLKWQKSFLEILPKTILW